MAAAPAIAPTRKLLITFVLRWIETCPSSDQANPVPRRTSGRPGRERRGERREREQADAVVAAGVGAVFRYVVAPVAQEQAGSRELRPLGGDLERLQHVLDEPQTARVGAEAGALGEAAERVGLGH